MLIIKTYQINGMTCGSCVSTVISALSGIPTVVDAKMNNDLDSVVITMEKDILLVDFQKSLNKKDPKYTIIATAIHDQDTSKSLEKSWFQVYKPILLLFFYITIVCFLIQIGDSIDWFKWMRHFMAGFFLLFSFFKMLDLNSFVNNYSVYDIIAKRWHSWGFIYVFIEFSLGIAYLTDIHSLITNMISFLVMIISIIGVIQSVIQNKKIKCACLGSVFNLPMSTITIVEDFLMILMSGFMIINIVWL